MRMLKHCHFWKGCHIARLHSFHWPTFLHLAEDYASNTIDFQGQVLRTPTRRTSLTWSVATPLHRSAVLSYSQLVSMPLSYHYHLEPILPLNLGRGHCSVERKSVN